MRPIDGQTNKDALKEASFEYCIINQYQVNGIS